MYDKKEEMKAIQKELLSKVKSACHDNGIPFIFLAATYDDGKSTEWLADGIPAGEINGMSLTDDRIRRAIAVLSGFDEELYENRAAKTQGYIYEYDAETNTGESEEAFDDDEFNQQLIEEDHEKNKRTNKRGR